MRVLGPEPRSSVRATSAFKHWTIYLSSSWHCVFVESQPFICGLSSILGLLSFPSIFYILEVKAKGLIQVKHFWQEYFLFNLSFWDRASRSLGRSGSHWTPAPWVLDCLTGTNILIGCIYVSYYIATGDALWKVVCFAVVFVWNGIHVVRASFHLAV